MIHAESEILTLAEVAAYLKAGKRTVERTAFTTGAGSRNGACANVVRQLPRAGRRIQGDGAVLRHLSTAGLLRKREVSGVGLLDHLDLQPCGAGFQEMWPV